MKRAFWTVALLIAFASGVRAQTPLGTDFTYQGSLELGGSPVTGTADFQFKLMNALTGGSQIGSTQPVNNVTVTNGGFTVPLDFGAVFNGDKRFLEIAVRSPAGSGSFTTLTPRQALTASPYSLKVPGVDGFSLDASDGSPTDALFVGPTGNVGIGTTAPAAKLHLKGAEEGIRIEGPVPGSASSAYVSFRDSNGAETGWVGDGSSGNSNIYLASTTGDVVLYTSNEMLRVKQDGKVGIGTTIPSTTLHVNGQSAWFTGGNGGGLPPSAGGGLRLYDDGVRSNIFAWDYASSSPRTLVLQEPGGNVGIGTTTPAAKLDVNGTARVKVLEITGADVAEKFPTTDRVEPGMVVAIDAENAGQLCLARGAYNRGVAGVVSGANGFSAGAVLGNLPGNEDAPPIALSGRVYVWCDASSGPIRPTDLLTTSDTPGHAMRASDAERSHGAIIGKAMTGLEQGRGLVLVLVNLQ